MVSAGGSVGGQASEREAFWRLDFEGPSGVRVDPRVARSKAAIGDAFLKELAEQGFGGVSIEGIAARAGIAKSTIYRHWSSKEDLLWSVLERTSELAASVIDTDPSIESVDDFWNWFNRAIQAVGRVMADPSWGAVVPALLDQILRNPDSRSLLHAFTRAQLDWLSRLLERGAALGLLRNDISGAEMAEVVVGSLGVRWLLLGEEVGADGLVEHQRGIVAALLA